MPTDKQQPCTCSVKPMPVTGFPENVRSEPADEYLLNLFQLLRGTVEKQALKIHQLENRLSEANEERTRQ